MNFKNHPSILVQFFAPFMLKRRLLFSITLLFSSLNPYSVANDSGQLLLPIQFRQGWNFFSVPVTPEFSDPDSFFEEKNVGHLWSYSNGIYQTESSIRGNQGYWIYLPEDLDLTFRCPATAQNAQVAQSLQAGWNTIAVTSPVPIPNQAAGTVWHWSNHTYHVATNPLLAGKGYWLNLENSETLEFGTLDADTDNDQIPDFWEQLWGLNVNDPEDAKNDSDADDLKNLAEFQSGTHPLLQDTDGDTISDGIESNRGGDPLNNQILPVTTIESSPMMGEPNVAVTRETIIRFSNPLADDAVVDETCLFAQFGDKTLAARIHLSPDRRSTTLFYENALPASSRIRVTLDGSAITDDLGLEIDVDGDGSPGGMAIIDFDTLSLTSIPNTSVCGRVFASTLTMNADESVFVNEPLGGVTITVDGMEDELFAVTDQFGDFRLENVPGGSFFVHINGHTVTDLNAGIRFPDMAYYPTVGKKWESVAGEEINVGEIYLPLIQANTLKSASMEQETIVDFSQDFIEENPEFDGVRLMVPPDSLFSDDGSRGGMIGIAPVDPDRLPGALPDTLPIPVVITIQTDGATNFENPVPACFPNLPDPDTGETLPAGAKSALWSFNHDTGRFEIVGPATVTEDGDLVCTDPGVGILAPGWHGIQAGAAWWGSFLNTIVPGIRAIFGLGPTSLPFASPIPGFFPGPTGLLPTILGKVPGFGPGGIFSPGGLLRNIPGFRNFGNPGGDNDPPGGQPQGDPTDPIYLFSGEFYQSVDDLRIKGRGPDFVWARKYRSKLEQKSAIGNGWDFSYNIFLKKMEPENPDELAPELQRLIRLGVSPDIMVYNGDTRADRYAYAGGNTWSRPEFFRELILNPDNGSFSLVFEDTGLWEFNPFDDSSSAGKIARIVDRNGNALHFAYDAQGRLEKVIDTLSRDILIGYDEDDFITTVTDFAGRVVHYDYYGVNEEGGNFGDLKSVTSPTVTGTPNGNDFPNGKTTSYTYTTGFDDERLNHNLLTATDGRRNDPNDPTFSDGPYLVNIYGSTTDPSDTNFDRVVRQIWGDPDDILDIVYVPILPTNPPNYSAEFSAAVERSTPAGNGAAIMRTIVNDRNGNVKEYFFDMLNRMVRAREYTGRADPDQPTTVSSNRPTGKLRETDPDFYDTVYEWNSDSLQKRIVYPNGNTTEFIYESDLDANAPPRSRRNLRITRDLPGTHFPAGDQEVIEESFEYEPRFNFMSKHVDGRENPTEYEYDDEGNLIHVQHRIPSVQEEFTYNEFGQTTSRTYPSNGNNTAAFEHRVDRYFYYTSGPQRGYLETEQLGANGDLRESGGDDLSLYITYEYDLVGNVIRTIDPRGHDTQLVVNELDQVVRKISREVADNSGVRYEQDIFYDANNNLNRLDIQNIDYQGNLQENSHFTHTYEYEFLNNLVRKTEEVSPDHHIVTEHEYDENRNRILTRNGEATNGNQPVNVVRMVYDERDLLFQETIGFGDSEESTTQYDYDPNKNLVVSRQGIEDKPRITHHTYDGYDRRVQTEDPMENTVSTHYDPNHNPTAVLTEGELMDTPGSDDNIRLTEDLFMYDKIDRVTEFKSVFFDTESQEAIDDGFSTIVTEYNDNSQIVRVVNDNQHQALNSYDFLNRLEIIVDHKGNTVRLEYDKNSNVIRHSATERSDLGGPDETFVISSAYDHLDRLIRTEDNVGNTTELAYDSRNNTTVTIDALGNMTRFTYDGINRPTQTTRFLTDTGRGEYENNVGGSSRSRPFPDQPSNTIDTITTTQTWDDSSRLTTQTDDNNNITTTTFDPLNRPIATTFADASVHTIAYDVHHNAIMMTDANGSETMVTFDLLDRVTRKDITVGASVSAETTFEIYKYDGLSRLVHAEDDDSLVNRRYNSLSAVTREILNGQTTDSVYDGVGNMLSCTYPGGRTIACTFDELERKKSISDADGMIANYDYIGPGRVIRRDYGNDTRCEYGYDGIVNVPNAANDFGFKHIIRTTHSKLSDSAIFDERIYSWDPIQNKTQHNDLIPGGLNQDYTYDSIYRMTQSTQTPDGGSPETTDYNLDGVGNRTTVAGGSNPGTYTLNTTLPDPGDSQLNQYTTTAFDNRAYDENGNLTTTNAGENVGGASRPRSITYNYRNQIVTYTNTETGETTTFAYDALGRRTQKIPDTNNPSSINYFYSDLRVCEEQDESGTTQATYVYGLYIDEVLAMQRDTDDDGTPEDYYYHTDDLYSVVKITDATGNITESYKYEDYGTPTIFDPSKISLLKSKINNSYLFQGRRYDPETQFFYFRNRYYDPVAGRFVQRDPVDDPTNLGNLYTFVGNNPATRLDPLGLSQQDNSGGGGGWEEFFEEELKILDEIRSTDIDSAADIANILDRVKDTKLDPFQVIPNFGPIPGLRDSLRTGVTESYRLGKGTGDYLYNNGSGWGIGKDALRLLSMTPVGAGRVGLLGKAKNIFGKVAQFLKGSRGGKAVPKRIQKPTDPYDPNWGKWYEQNPGVPRACFVGGTLVHTEEGTKPIEDVNISDLVWSYDELTQNWGLSRVSDLLIHNYNDAIYTIEVANVTIDATSNHPFWVVSGQLLASRPRPVDIPDEEFRNSSDGRWTEAKDLRPGDLLLTRNGSFAEIKSVNQDYKNITVFNLSIDELHNYAVSEIGVLAHNKAAPKAAPKKRLSGRDPPISPRQRLHTDGTPGKSQFNPNVNADDITRTAWEQGKPVFNQNNQFIGKRFTFDDPIGISPSGHPQNTVFVHWSPKKGIHGVPTTRSGNP